MEEPRSFVILEDIGTKANMDYITNLREPIDVFEGQLLHSTRSRTLLCLKNLLSTCKENTKETIISLL